MRNKKESPGSGLKHDVLFFFLASKLHAPDQGTLILASGNRTLSSYTQEVTVLEARLCQISQISKG